MSRGGTASTRVVLMPNWVGDFLLALAVVSEKVRSDGIPTTLVVPEHLTALSSALTDLPQVSYRRNGLAGIVRTAWRLRRLRCDILYILPYSFSAAFLGFLSGIPRRRGVDRDGRRALLTEPLPRSTRTSKKHVTCEYAAVLDTQAPRVEEWEGRPVAGAEQYAGSVVLCPGARFGPARLWPHYAELARILVESRIVVEGSVDEQQAAQWIAAAAPDRVADLCGTSLVEAAAVLSVAACVVSNDSGLMHLAGYVGAPVVGIFGSTPPTWTRPLGRRVTVLYRGEPCSPCFDRTCRYGHMRCLAELGAPEVAAAVRAWQHGRAP